MFRNIPFFVFLYVGFLLLAAPAKAQVTGCGRLYVDSAVTTSGNGSSWATAFKTVTQALDSANNGTCTSREIWVRKGTYRPMVSTTLVASSRDSSFRILRNGIKLYGGFAGTETTLIARNIVTNPTILSGDIGVTGDTTDNSYHVVTVVANIINGVYIDTNTRLDGFAIKGGNARGTGNLLLMGKFLDRSAGGGMYTSSSSPTITNCSFYFNTGIFGGGIFNETSSPVITNCTFSSNTGFDGGGGMYNTASPAVINCTFLSNSAGEGGGMYNGVGSPTISNCTFSSNTSTGNGGGIRGLNGSPVITNCTFSSNISGGNGGGIYTQLSTNTVSNCSFSSNAAINGGGIFNDYSSNSITKCTFSANTAGSGGGVYNNVSTSTIRNCTFASNSVTGDGGGVINAPNSSIVQNTISIVNCTFSFNTSLRGGGVCNSSSAISNSLPTNLITNCTFYSNTATSLGGAVDNNFPPLAIKNCIMWGNTSGSGPSIHKGSFYLAVVSYTTTETAIMSGATNSTANPLFLNTANLIGPDGIWRTADDGLQLQAGSPAINAGDNSAIPTGITTDIMDSLRIRQGTVDMGAYEFIPFTCPAGPVVYVDSSKALSGNGSSWTNAYRTLSEGLYAANNCTSVTQLWVAKGTYYPMASRTAVAASRDSSFRVLRNGIKMYGGFAGNETLLSARNVAANPTVLSGDIGIANDSIDNCYHVVTVVSSNTIDTNTRLDGFTIRKGNANGSTTPFGVAGNNLSRYAGGGLYNASSAPLITACIFTFNSGTEGGGMHNALSSPFIKSCIFASNSGINGGGYTMLPLPLLLAAAFSSPTAATAVAVACTMPLLRPKLQMPLSMATAASTAAVFPTTILRPRLQMPFCGETALPADPLFTTAGAPARWSATAPPPRRSPAPATASLIRCL